jgi:Ca-activated chloride channel family protein
VGFDPTIGFQNGRVRDDREASIPPADIVNYPWNWPSLHGLASSAVGPLVEARGATEFTLKPGEELWIIERRTTIADNQPRSDDLPGSGCLMTQVQCPPDPNQPYARELAADGASRVTVPVPLKHTDVRSRIDGYIGTVSVTQQFVNPFSEKIEALYVFPLPENAAVNEFLMTIGDRTIRGIIREREEAERIYSEARRQGYAASLLTQERPNIFTQHVANIEPGKQIDVEIRYFHTLAYRDGWFEWVFPMVVGPRFNPPCSSDGVGAVARGQFGASGQKTEVQYLRPSERSGYDIAVTVSLDAGVPIESLECRTHQVSVTADRATPSLAEVRLSSLDSIPNKDFVLRYRVAGRDVKSAMLTQVSDKGGFFSLMLVPPAELDYLDRGPMEMVFVLDCSGSMEGEPLAQAKRAAEKALQALGPDDTFQIINFAESASQLGDRPIAATYDNVRRGLGYLQSLTAGGGTYMINGLRAALGFRHDPRRLRFVCFLTDGYIGNEAEILAELRKGLDDSRIFAMGIGSSVNRYLIEEMAQVGRGAAAFITPDDDAADVMDKVVHRISHAALTDLKIDWGGMQVDDVYPKRLPDLYVGRPVIVTGRYRGSGSTTVKVTGRAAGEKTPILIPVNLDGRDAAGGRGSLAAVWARAKIGDLYTQAIAKRDDSLVPSIRRTALEFGLMSAYTAFVAVDSLARTAGSIGTTVEQPVPVPEGVEYETTVQERRAARRWPGQDRP